MLAGEYRLLLQRRPCSFFRVWTRPPLWRPWFGPNGACSAATSMSLTSSGWRPPGAPETLYGEPTTATDDSEAWKRVRELEAKIDELNAELVRVKIENADC
jgi:hypothetical protein